MEKKIETNLDNDGLRDIAKGTVRFSIKADDTLENLQVHSAFKEFCRIETDNNYTQGIRKLMEYFQSDYKYEMIVEKIGTMCAVSDDLRASIIELKETPKEEVKEEEGSF
jgi:hypothetical protein